MWNAGIHLQRVQFREWYNISNIWSQERDQITWVFLENYFKWNQYYTDWLYFFNFRWEYFMFIQVLYIKAILKQYWIHYLGSNLSWHGLRLIILLTYEWVVNIMINYVQKPGTLPANNIKCKICMLTEQECIFVKPA